ncbi:MAG: ankyrin repeat domain-containing protein [Sedimentisphaerales bacterium]|nr:ankyrin repeat domain-containing protein [Sedimentisphaerales bacterium]
MTTFRWSPRICVAVLLVVAWASTLVPAASQLDELTKVLPDDLLFFVATGGADAVEGDFEKSILGRLWNDPGVQSFYSSIKTELLTTIERESPADPDFSKVLGKVLDYARCVLQRPVVLGAAPAQVRKGPPACLFAILDAGAREVELVGLVNRAEAALGEDEIVETEIGSLRLRRLRDDDDVPLYWGWVGTYLVIAANDVDGLAVKHLASPRATVPPYVRKVPGHGDVLAAYYDHARTLRVIEAIVAQQGGAETFGVVKAALADLGLADLGVAFMRAGFAGPDLVSDAYMEVPEPRTGLLAALGPIESSALSLADAQAVTATAFNCDLAAVYDVIMKVIKTISPQDVCPRAQRGLAQLEAQSGFRIRDGLLKSAAGPVVLYAYPAGKMLDAPMGGFVAVAKVADARLFEETMVRISEFVNAKAEGVLQTGSQTDGAGHTIRIWASSALALAGVMPSWAIVEDQLVIGSNTALCKRGIARIVPKSEGDGALPGAEGYQKVAANLPDRLLGLRYTDSAVQFRQAMIQMQPLWQMMVMMAMQKQVRLPVVLPSLDHIFADMQPTCEYVYLKSDGLYSHYQGPGLDVSLQTTAGGALGMGILMPALARVRQLAFRMTSGTNLSGIGKACLIYANDHEDRLPPDLETLVREVQVSPKSLESKLKPEGFKGPSYIYIAGQTTMMSPRNVVAYDNPAFCEDGVNVLFLDSHVEFMKPDEFRLALRATCRRLGRETPQIRFKNEDVSPDEAQPAGDLRAESIEALHEAAQRGDVQTARRLIEQGTPIDAADGEGQTALYVALRSGQVEVASLLIRAGADVNLHGGTWGTPLFVGARLGQTETVELLIERGADVNSATSTGWTPLLLAARFGYTEIARLLLDAGADIHARTREQMTPLLFAVLHKRPEIERLLIEKGAQFDVFADAMRGDSQAVAAWLRESPEVLRDSVGHLTLLHWAAYCNHLNVAEVLLERGADVDADAQVASPLHWAVRKNHLDLARLLLNSGAHVNAANRDGMRVIHQVVAPEMVELLVECGADVNVRANDDVTPLHFVVSANGHREVLKALLPEDADIDLTYSAEVHLKASEQQAFVVEALLKHGAEVNARASGRITALDMAERLGYEPVARMLRRHGGQRGTELRSNVAGEPTTDP